MPIKKVQGGYKWGNAGKTYPKRSGAVKQAAAAYASGFKRDDKPAKSHEKSYGKAHELIEKLSGKKD